MTYTTRLPQIVTELAARISVGLDRAAEVIAEDAASRVHRGPDPHHIADDIHVEKVDVLTRSVVAGRTDTFYGHILEHGGKGHAPRPFLVPALEENKGEAIAIVRKAVDGL